MQDKFDIAISKLKLRMEKMTPEERIKTQKKD